MSSNDFSPKTIVSNFKELFADKKQFVFECVRIGLVFFYFIWLFIPFFTLRTTAGAVVAHFNVVDHAFIFGFLWVIIWFGGLAFFVLSLLTSLKKFSHFFLVGIGGIQFIYWFVTLISFWINAADLRNSGLTGFKLTLNVGFWFILLHIGMVAALAFLPKPFKLITDKIVEAATKGKPAAENKEEPKAEEPKVEEPKAVEPKEEKPVEPKVEEPQPKQEPPVEAPKEAAPVEEPKEEVKTVEEVKPEEPTEEVKPEQLAEEEKK